MTEVICYRIASRNPRRMIEEVRASNPGLVVQGVKDEGIANEFFFKMVTFQTLRAMATGNLIAKKPEIDLLLRLARTTQIAEALKKVGARGGEAFVLIIAGKKEAIDSVATGPSWKRLKRTRLSQKELSLIEEAALLNASRG